MKAFLASYRWSGSRGAYDNREVVVVAETQSAALGWVLGYYEDTVADCWEFEEIDIQKAGITYVSSRCS